MRKSTKRRLPRAPFFEVHRFGEANQPDAYIYPEVSDCIIVQRNHRGGLYIEVDCYTLENPEEAKSRNFDSEKWEDLKQGLETTDCSREAFCEAYRIARLLRRGITVTLDGPPGNLCTLLCAHYWQPDKRRLIPREAGHA